MGGSKTAPGDVEMSIWIPAYSRDEIIERAKSLIGREVARSTNFWASQGKITCLEMVGYAYGWPDEIPRTWDERAQMIEKMQAVLGWRWRQGHIQPADLLVFEVRGPHLGVYVGDGRFIHCGAARVIEASLERFGPYLKGGLTWVF